MVGAAGQAVTQVAAAAVDRLAAIIGGAPALAGAGRGLDVRRAAGTRDTHIDRVRAATPAAALLAAAAGAAVSLGRVGALPGRRIARSRQMALIGRGAGDGRALAGAVRLADVAGGAEVVVVAKRAGVDGDAAIAAGQADRGMAGVLGGGTVAGGAAMADLAGAALLDAGVGAAIAVAVAGVADGAARRSLRLAAERARRGRERAAGDSLEHAAPRAA